MIDPTRRLIIDLIARHELEPELDDVYVEGLFDKEVLERIFSKSGQLNRVVYEIDSIEVPPDLVKSHKLTDGNKQRVVALARELATIKDQCAYRCLVDRDLDHWFGPLEDTKRLSWTEPTSIETYYFSEEFVKEILLVLAKAKITDWGRFFNSFVEVLKALYCLRLADRSLELNCKWLALPKSLTGKNNEIHFNVGDYIKKLLQANSSLKRKEEFEKQFAFWQAKLTGEPNSFVRGHDFVFMISWSIGAFKGIPEYNSELAIERLLVLFANHAAGVVAALA